MWRNLSVLYAAYRKAEKVKTSTVKAKNRMAQWPSGFLHGKYLLFINKLYTILETIINISFRRLLIGAEYGEGFDLTDM